MLRLVCIGDPHFKVDNVNKMTLFTDLVEEWCKKQKPDIIICLGDILHTHRTVHVKPLSMATEFLHRMIRIAKTYLIIGNHDRPDNSNYLTEDHAFNAFKSVQGISIVDRGLVETINGFNLAFIPYVPPGKFRDAYEQIVGKTPIDMIFAHQEFRGCKLNELTGTTSSIGDNWSMEMPPVISGHIHNKHILGNVFYVGTPVQENRSENPDKGIHLITLQERMDENSDVEAENDKNMENKQIKEENKESEEVEVTEEKETNEEIEKIDRKEPEFKLGKTRKHDSGPKGLGSSKRSTIDGGESIDIKETKSIEVEKIEIIKRRKIDIEFEYYRILVPPELTVVIKADELSNFKLPEGHVTLIIEGSQAEIKSLRGSSIIKDLKKKKVKVLTKATGIEMGKVVHKNKAFLDIVYSSLSKSKTKYLQKLIEEAN